MDAIEAIRSRRSAPRLGGAVARDRIAELIALATCAPNHRLTEPWRFTVVTGDARERLGRLWGTRSADARAFTGEERERAIARDVEKLLRAPVLIIVSTRTDGDPVVAEEDFAASAAAVQNILIGAHAHGLGAMWRTGGMVHDPEVKVALGLDERDRIVATIYLGDPCGSLAPERPRALPIVWWGDSSPV